MKFSNYSINELFINICLNRKLDGSLCHGAVRPKKFSLNVNPRGPPSKVYFNPPPIDFLIMHPKGRRKKKIITAWLWIKNFIFCRTDSRIVLKVEAWKESSLRMTYHCCFFAHIYYLLQKSIHDACIIHDVCYLSSHCVERPHYSTSTSIIQSFSLEPKETCNVSRLRRANTNFKKAQLIAHAKNMPLRGLLLLNLYSCSWGTTNRSFCQSNKSLNAVGPLFLYLGNNIMATSTWASLNLKKIEIPQNNDSDNVYTV